MESIVIILVHRTGHSKIAKFSDTVGIDQHVATGHITVANVILIIYNI